MKSAERRKTGVEKTFLNSKGTPQSLQGLLIKRVKTLKKASILLAAAKLIPCLKTNTLNRYSQDSSKILNAFPSSQRI
jgi:hypothetical protein